MHQVDPVLGPGEVRSDGGNEVILAMAGREYSKGAVAHADPKFLNFQYHFFLTSKIKLIPFSESQPTILHLHDTLYHLIGTNKFHD